MGLNPKKIVGITTLDIVRANKFVQEITGKLAQIPVIGGHAGKTILPLFSQDPAGATIDAGKVPDLDVKVQDAGTEVVKAKEVQHFPWLILVLVWQKQSFQAWLVCPRQSVH